MQPGYMELSHEPGDGRYTYIKISRYIGGIPKPGRCVARLRNINHSNGAAELIRSTAAALSVLVMFRRLIAGDLF